MDTTSFAAETDSPVMPEKGFTVDPFLVEVLQNPRHRLTILRMELDIQRFLQSPEQQQFEFQHFPTSYLRLAAHRVANHYGLITSVQDSGVDGNGSRILVAKSAESRFPAVRLSEIPAKQPESGKFEHMKIAIKPRPSKGTEAGELEKKGGPLRSVEEREEDYEKARARIFNSLENLSCNDSSSETNAWKMNCTPTPSRDENQVLRNGNIEADNSRIPRESMPASRVAIIRDREKDRYDPDYDRNYQRYIRSLPVDHNFALAHFNLQKMGTPPFYDMGFNGYGHNASAPPSLNLGPHPVMSPYVTTGLNHPSRDAAMYMQWPNAAAVMYTTHSYDHFRNAPIQAQFCPQPLSFDYMQNR